MQIVQCCGSNVVDDVSGKKRFVVIAAVLRLRRASVGKEDVKRGDVRLSGCVEPHVHDFGPVVTKPVDVHLPMQEER